VNSDLLRLTLSPADHAAAITVFNPGPGGGLSNALAAFLGAPVLAHHSSVTQANSREAGGRGQAFDVREKMSIQTSLSIKVCKFG